jgi:hypothetical protein
LRLANCSGNEAYYRQHDILHFLLQSKLLDRIKNVAA